MAMTGNTQELIQDMQNKCDILKQEIQEVVEETIRDRK
jgi:hypothetical protein